MEDKKVELVFRNVNNEDVKLMFDIGCDVDIKKVKEQLCDVLLHKERKCNEGDNTGSNVVVNRMKLFFKGRPLRDNELLMDLHVSNKDVMLYMITSPLFVSSSSSSSMGIHDEQMRSSERQCVNSNNNDSNVFDTSSIIESVNHVNNNNNENTNTNAMLTINRGFNRFVLYGVSPNEIAMIRLFFHSSMYQRSIQHNITLDWSREGILEREEMWLRSQSNNLRLNDHHHHNRNNNNTTLRLTRRYNRYDETNVAFVKGFLLGFILNIFGIIFMILVRNLSIKFKCGFHLGILMSISCCIIPYLLHSM
jgi:hypothetical protein